MMYSKLAEALSKILWESSVKKKKKQLVLGELMFSLEQPARLTSWSAAVLVQTKDMTCIKQSVWPS